MAYVAGDSNKIYEFDSFEGMPNITEKNLGEYNKSDIHNFFYKELYGFTKRT